MHSPQPGAHIHTMHHIPTMTHDIQLHAIHAPTYFAYDSSACLVFCACLISSVEGMWCYVCALCTCMYFVVLYNLYRCMMLHYMLGLGVCVVCHV